MSFDGLGVSGADIAQFPSRGAATMLVVGADADVSDKGVVLPAATAIAAEQVPLVVADVYVKTPDGPARGDTLDAIHDSDALASVVSTVDDLDQPQGPATAVLALSALLQTPATVCQCGLASGTPLPDITAK